MIVLPGREALSQFRRARLEARLQRALPGASVPATQWLYFIDLDAGVPGLDAGQADALRRLLEADGPALPGAGVDVADTVRCGEAGGQWRYVVPRLGTISPWSSKASEIVRGAGLPVQRVERGCALQVAGVDAAGIAQLAPLLHDPMTQSLLDDVAAADGLFRHGRPGPLQRIPLAGLAEANGALGLALSDDEIEYLAQRYGALGRDPTDAELMMFAQANSEHCRHKIFNARYRIDGEEQPHSLFQMIRNTQSAAPQLTLSAYSDNAAVVEGMPVRRFAPDGGDVWLEAPLAPGAFQIKVETHNHPTAIAPFPGAATGSGGEIRDEGATGRGARPKAGLSGFTVSHLRIPTLPQPWEGERPLNPRMASALEIMLDGPIGAAAFNNEFGRPALTGYFRSFELPTQEEGLVRGYDKPIMLAGGLGSIERPMVAKLSLRPGDAVVVLGGPAMLIGLGGGAASSVAAGQSSEALDFASVQRDNPEMQRRCQEVIDRCVGMGEHNPVRSIHDVGAGGLSNAIPELLHDSSVGGRIDLSALPSDDPSLSPMQLWSNESQERYVLGIAAEALDAFEAIARRERCPYAIVGHATAEQQLVLADPNAGEPAIDIPMDLLFGKPPKMERDTTRPAPPAWPRLDPRQVDLAAAALQVLAHPSVAAKQFLVTIGDRSVGGLVARDQMVGPWQVPVADCAITLGDFSGHAGEAMALGERTPLALIDAAASARMAVGEALTNLAAAPVASLSEVKLSANWMAAAGHPGEDALLFDAVRAVGLELCPELDIGIPVGKDSLSMQARWRAGGAAGEGARGEGTRSEGAEQRCVSPVSLVVTAFARVVDVRTQLTPVLRRDVDSELWLIGLGAGKQRLGGSVLAQVSGQFGGACPDLDEPERLVAFFHAIQEARASGFLLAYHDRSDGGAFATLCEMAFASHLGVDILLDGWAENPVGALFAEELGAVVQVAIEDRVDFADLVNRHGLTHCVQRIGRPTTAPRVRVQRNGKCVAEWEWRALFDAWWSPTHALQALRDEPACADEEREAARDFDAAPLHAALGFDAAEDVAAPFIATGARPRVAILREQGVNGHYEMAAAFTRAGFEAVDVHMSDLAGGRHALADFQGLAACGGFSYGDVLGAGRGWGMSILEHAVLRDQFAAFFARPDSFTLGVCNGCQMLSVVRELIPGAGHWPRFLRNRSEQFEARFSLLRIESSPSWLLAGMEGSLLPVVVSHGEGRARYDSAADADAARVAARYAQPDGSIASTYPANPNGSPDGIAALTSDDGRATILMPHPERVFRTVQMSWQPPGLGEDSPWMRIFRNARVRMG